MTKTLAPGTPLFGDWNQSVLWAICGASAGGAPRNQVLLPPGQVIFAIPVSAPLRWREGGAFDTVEPGSVALFDTRKQRIAVETGNGSDVVLIGMRHGAMSGLLESFRPGLASGVRELVFGSASHVLLEARAEILGQIVPAMRQPPVAGAARGFWYESQFKALISLLCFVPTKGEGEFFCSRQKRLARVRVAKAKARLEPRLDEVFDLNRLAAEVGCSPSYLSRTFSSTTGMTISQYLRKRRIEKAADLLVTGRYNVSEVAIEVGYQSLSHFSKAFQQVKGCLPSKYEAA